MSQDLYTVGWVCALPEELAAAKEMLDEDHGLVSYGDKNIYTLGRIGNHNIYCHRVPANEPNRHYPGRGSYYAHAAEFSVNPSLPSCRYRWRSSKG